MEAYSGFSFDRLSAKAPWDSVTADELKQKLREVNQSLMEQGKSPIVPPTQSKENMWKALYGGWSGNKTSPFAGPAQYHSESIGIDVASITIAEKLKALKNSPRDVKNLTTKVHENLRTKLSKDQRKKIKKFMKEEYKKFKKDPKAVAKLRGKQFLDYFKGNYKKVEDSIKQAGTPAWAAKGSAALAAVLMSSPFSFGTFVGAPLALSIPGVGPFIATVLTLPGGGAVEAIMIIKGARLGGKVYKTLNWYAEKKVTQWKIERRERRKEPKLQGIASKTAADEEQQDEDSLATIAELAAWTAAYMQEYVEEENADIWLAYVLELFLTGKFSLQECFQAADEDLSSILLQTQTL
jgi:hypothetical protein